MKTDMLFHAETLKLTFGGRDVVDLPELRVEAAQHLLLLGPSGCGKTSVMNLLAGLIPPSAGSIAFRDKTYRDLSESEIDRLRAAHFGFVFQRLHLIGHLSVFQNIALAQQAPDPGMIHQLAADLGLSDKLRQNARDLSVGEAQRAAIARAAANKPSVIFADEPTSALDDANTGHVMDLLLAHAEKTGATLIVATHDARIQPHFSKIREMQI